MNDDQKASLLVTAIFTVVIALLVLGIYWGKKYQCERLWEGSGMKSEYRAFQGCRIQLKDGRWIPAANYREL